MRIHQRIAKVVAENRSLLVFFGLMLMFRSAVADWMYVPSGSMNPTIVEGDRVLIDKAAYGWRAPFTTVRLTQGTAGDLKARVGAERLVVGIADSGRLGAAAACLRPLADGEPTLDPAGRRVVLPVAGAAHLAARAVRTLDEAGIAVGSLEIRGTTLDEAFLALTGHASATDERVA